MAKCVFDKNNPNTDLEDKLMDLCESVWDAEESREKKALFINGLKNVGEGYDSSSLADLSDFIVEYVGDNYPDLTDVVPTNTDVYLAGKSSNIEDIVEESDSKTAALEAPDTTEEGNIPTRNFIAKAYGTATEVRLAMEAGLKKSIVNSIMVNRLEGTVIDSVSMLNSEIRKYQESLLSSIVDFLKTKYSSMKSGRYNTEEALAELDELVMYRDGEYTDALDKVNKLAEPFLSPSKLTSDDLNNYYSQAANHRGESEQFINAYNSYIILNNFDGVMKSQLRKVLVIKPNTYGKFTYDNKYSLSDHTSNLPTSWRTTEDINAEAEIGDLVRLLIETTPMYLWQSTSPLSNRNIGLQEANYIVSKIKDLMNSSDSKMLKFDGLFFSENPRFEKYRSYLYGKSMYSLLANIRTNPERNLPIIFEVLTDPKVFYENSSGMLRGFYKPDMDLMYSLYKGIFENSQNSLYGIKLRNPGKANYFGYVTQAFNSISTIKYAQYFFDDDGNLSMRTLKDSNDNDIRRYIENRINGMLSKVASIKYDDLLEKYNAKWDSGVFTFSIPSARLDVKFDPKAKRGQAFNVYRTNEDGTTVKVGTFEGKADWDNLTDFFSDFLKVDLSSTSAFAANYLSMKTSRGHIQYDSAINDLLQFSSSVFFNSYVSHKIIDTNEGWAQVNGTLEGIYGMENKPQIVKSWGEMSLISRAYTPVLSDLANATSMTNGVFTNSVVKDGEGNGLGTTTITRLFTEPHVQWVNQIGNSQTSAARGFSILNNPRLLKDVIVSRELKGREGSKRHSQFNVAESYYSSLVLDYVGGLVSHGENSKRDAVSGFMPSVNSDKTTVLKMLISMNEMSAAKKLYSQLTRDEIRGLINSEIGAAYSRITDNILSDFGRLNDFAASRGIDAKLNPLTNFREFNLAYGKDAANQLASLIRSYEAEYGMGSIELIDQVHYINNKGILAFNRSLVSLTNRFNPNYFRSRGFDPTSVFGKLSTADEFWDIKERELLSDMLDNNFLIETTDEYGRPLTTPEIQYFSKMNNWINPNTKRVILGKFTPTGGSTVNISKWSDFGSLSYTEADQFGNPKTYTYLTDGFDITKLDGKLELHPTIANQNAMDYLFTQEYMMSTVGSHISHSAKKAANSTSDLVEEAARYKAQDKRNVSFTASIHTFQQGPLNSIPSVYNIAVIEDLKAAVYNIMGDFDSKGAAVYDGATFVNPFIVYLENNALGGAKAGIDKKQFIHAYKSNTATGIIIKTAGFGLTNDRIRNSLFYQIMMRKMTDHRWKDDLGQPYIPDILTDYAGNKIRYDDIYYKDQYGNYHMISDIENLGNGMYSYKDVLVDKYGSVIGMPVVKQSGPIDSNYALWNFFGGARSASLKNGRLELSETSIANVEKAMNRIGIVTNPNGEVNTQDDIYQVLKHSDVHYVATAGAVKQGGANINSFQQYIDDLPYTTMKIRMDYAGIQLNAEHSADEANLSIMTQVISAIASRGYTSDLAQEVYDALSRLAEFGIKDYIDGFNKYLKSDNPAEFQNVIARTMVKAMMNTSERDGNMVQAVAQELIDMAREGKKLTFKDVEGIIPYSDPSVFNQLVTTVTSALTKSAIRVKFAGSLNVLNPSHGIWKLYGNRKLESFNNEEELKALQNLYDSNPIYSLSRIKLGRTYNFMYPDGAVETRLIETPQQYWDLHTEFGNRPEVIITENVIKGRDLEGYGIEFQSVSGDKFNMWDLDAIKLMYTFREGVDRIKGSDSEPERVKALSDIREWMQANGLSLNMKESYATLQASLQNTLAALGSGNADTVLINGQEVQVDKSSINVSAYEAIMPKIYAQRFGLTSEDDVDTIVNDPLFFVRRMIDSWESKVDDRDFDIELKRLNGKHTYLVNKDTFKSTTLSPIEVNKLWDGDKLYRVDELGNKIHRLASESDEVYVDADGNEVIVTNDLGFYVGSSGYHSLRVSDSAAISDHLEQILEPIFKSSSRAAKSFARYVGDKNAAYNISYMNSLYREGMQSVLDNPNAAVEDPVIQMIYNSATEVHTSFIKSLDMLAARIPSQTMQSFMPMKVVAFDNPDVNSVYVNYWQIWLQGSDFDIDKVSMLGFSFDRTGKFVGWSPYFNLHSTDTLKASETLPFPTGKEVEIVPTSDASLTNWGNDYVGSGKLFNFNGSKLVFLPDYGESSELNAADTVRSLSSFLRMVNRNGGKLYVPSGSRLPFDQIAKKINNHNLYLDKANSDSGMDMIRNFISSYMYRVSIDPINLIQSQSPIDKATEPIRQIGDSSPAAQRVKKMTPGNTFNKHMSLFENMAGKEVVGISAAGMKIFFALTQYYNSTLNSGDPSKQMHLLFNRKIGSQEVKMLANSWVSNSDTVTNEDVFNALLQVNNTTDAALILSAILSLATDNAKELQLAKINAGADMVSLYIYGIAAGFDFRTIANAMMSRTARIISSIKAGNAFNGDVGIPFLTNVFEYIDEGPDLSNLDPEFIGTLSNALSNEGDVTPFAVRKLLVSMANEGSPTDFRMDEKMRFIKDLKNRVLTFESESARISSFKFLDKLSEYISNLQAIRTDFVKDANGSTFYPYEAIKTLYYGGSELRRLGGMLGLNQGLKTKVNAKLAFIKNFENLFTDRFGEFSRDESVREYQLSQPAIVNGEVTTIGAAFQMLANLVHDDNLDEFGDVIDSRKYRISFDRFMNDETYRNDVIEIYNGVKHSFNILDVMWTLPHYRSYLKAAYIDYSAQKVMSAKFRMIDKIGGEVIDKYGFRSSKDVLNVYKGVQSFIDNFLVNSWLKTSNKTVNVQKGVTVFSKGDSEFVTTETTPILLGADWGNASFKSWMESTVIPDLKDGIYNEGSRVFMDNKFIRDLTPIRMDRTPNKRSTIVYTLPISMIPRSDSEKISHAMYKSEFNKLQSLRYYGHPVSDLFFYYNLINSRNAVNQIALTPMFEDALRNRTSPLLNEYKAFISKFDTSSDLIEGVDYTIEDAMIWCAPIMDTNKARTPYVYSYDYNTMTTKLYRRINNSDNNGGGDYMEDMDFDYGIDFDFDMGMEDTNTLMMPSKDYEVVEEHRNSRYYMTRESLLDSGNTIRLSANTVISTEGSNLREVRYKNKTYTKGDLLALGKDLGVKAEDLDIPFTVKRVGDSNEEVIDSDNYLQILEHILNNPC